jgi:membrane-associated protein
LLDLLLHVDQYLLALTEAYHHAVYGILFLILFCETGLVVTPFLPGDSLLFAAGALAANGALRLEWLLVLLIAAAVAGDAVNYRIGRFSAARIARREKLWFVNQEHFDQAQRFYERYGNLTIILARFVPIVRTFAPFVAGVGRMSPARFAASNAVGAVCWVGLCVGAGYFWGNLAFVKRNFSLVILAIVAVSVVPILISALRTHARKRSVGGPQPQAAAEVTEV